MAYREPGQPSTSSDEQAHRHDVARPSSQPEEDSVRQRTDAPKPSRYKPKPSKAPVITTSSDDEQIGSKLPVCVTEDQPEDEHRPSVKQEHTKSDHQKKKRQAAAEPDSDKGEPDVIEASSHQSQTVKQEERPFLTSPVSGAGSDTPEDDPEMSDAEFVERVKQRQSQTKAKPKPSQKTWIRLRVKVKSEVEDDQPPVTQPTEQRDEPEDDEATDQDEPDATQHHPPSDEDPTDMSKASIVEIYTSTFAVDIQDVYKQIMTKVAERGSIMAKTTYGQAVYVRMRTPCQAERVLERTNRVKLAQPTCIELR